MMSPVGGSHSSRKSRWLTWPSQQPLIQASGASGPLAGLAAALSTGLSAAGTPAGGIAGGVAGACAEALPGTPASSAMASIACRYVEVIVRLSSLRPRQRQIQQQVLRLQAKTVLAIHRHRQVYRPSGDRRTHRGGIGKAQREQAQQPFPPLVGDIDAVVQIVEQGACLGVEPDMPDPARVDDLPLRRDGDVYRQEMGDP